MKSKPEKSIPTFEETRRRLCEDMIKHSPKGSVKSVVIRFKGKGPAKFLRALTAFEKTSRKSRLIARAAA